MPEKKALVTGGAGFIGSHLAEKLLASGYAVHVIDDLSTGSFDNIAHLETDHRFRYTIDTVVDASVMEKLVDDCDIVFHLAAAVGVNYVIENQLKSIQVNVRGTEVVLELANRGKKKVILFSTSEIYGKSVAVPFKEGDDRILGPTTLTRWSYAVTKAIDEIMSLAYHREKKLPVVILRCFNICGPRQTGQYGMVLPRFVKQALLGNPITVYGDGKQTRCFASVYDLVDGVVKVAECDDAVGQVFNIGSDVEVSIRDLAEKVKRLTDSVSPIEHVPYEKAYGKGFEDMMRRVPDLSKIKSMVGYEPVTDLDSIVASVIAYLKS
jgi:UDP-glucose 4-epimerase